MIIINCSSYTGKHRRDRNGGILIKIKTGQIGATIKRLGFNIGADQGDACQTSATTKRLGSNSAEDRVDARQTSATIKRLGSNDADTTGDCYARQVDIELKCHVTDGKDSFTINRLRYIYCPACTNIPRDGYAK